MRRSGPTPAEGSVPGSGRERRRRDLRERLDRGPEEAGGPPDRARAQGEWTGPEPEVHGLTFQDVRFGPTRFSHVLLV